MKDVRNDQGRFDVVFRGLEEALAESGEDERTFSGDLSKEEAEAIYELRCLAAQMQEEPNIRTLTVA